MKQRGILFAVFILIELAILVEIGRATSTAVVIAEVFISGIFGYLLITSTTKSTGIRAKLALWTMELPAQSMLKGFMTIIGAILLILPGIVTDVLGLVLVFPLTQGLVINHFKTLSPRIFKH